MQPFYFGTLQKPLFGIYQAPQAGSERNHGIVLCNPMGREYILAHRTFRQLAMRLTQVGFHVLRFDYYGCGDSAGESDEGSIEQWLHDIATAIEEIRDRGSLTKVSLIGLRWGATLSVLCGTRRSDFENVVLWEPIINGKSYLAELTTSHNNWLRNQLSKGRQTGKNVGKREMLGFPLTDTMYGDLEKINLLIIQHTPTKRSLIVESDKKLGTARFLDHLRNLGVPVDYEHIPGPKFWTNKGRNDEPLIPMQVLQSIVSWMSRSYE